MRKIFMVVFVVGVAWMFFAVGMQEPRGTRQISSPTPKKQPGQVGGERAAGLEQAKRVLQEMGLVPTTANWPWEMVRSTETSKGQFLVRGTVEYGSNVRPWSTIILLENGNLQGCSVTCGGRRVWTHPDYEHIVTGL